MEILDLDLKAMGMVPDGADKNFGSISIIIPIMNLIHHQMWKLSLYKL